MSVASPSDLTGSLTQPSIASRATAFSGLSKLPSRSISAMRGALARRCCHSNIRPSQTCSAAIVGFCRQP